MTLEAIRALWVDHPHDIAIAATPRLREIGTVKPDDAAGAQWYWRVDYSDSGAIRGWDAGYEYTREDAIEAATRAMQEASER